ncbi:hypothetical protein B5G34_00255 [Flavonifractor sp. An82]|uniref:hypothetical protein n=1 Tax=Flavonifractor sp. An82 TaxID=1965660 RepID=UPI000B3735B7|nr:hypothetical protein [Flavonifractor sp. An82]OUN23569.1 hypothetical protein B5G34_00255 [Flavonifractor sp. An82]
MERLTYRHKDQNGNPTDCISQQINLKYIPRKDWLEKIAIRLADIEDILGEDYDLDRLRELVEADRDGRCVVSPCKVGSPVWRVYDDCEFPGDCYTKQKCKGCEYRNVFAEEQAFCLSMLSQNGKLEHPYYTSLEASEDTLAGER